MKKTLWNITLASLMTLVAYIVVVFILRGVILKGIDNPTLTLLIIALVTTAVFGFFLLYTSKIRKSVGESEVISDYKDREYVSFVDDFKLILKRESKMLISIVAIVLICFALNAIDQLVFGKSVISIPAFFFAPMCFFGGTVSNIPFVGYAVSAVLDCVAYIAFLLIYRKKKYNYWMKNK